MEDRAQVAVALRHDADAVGPPRVVAKGRGALAARIVELARAHGIAVQRDQELSRLLAPLELDSPIPLAAFAAVAEILARRYEAERALRAGRGHG